MRHKLLPDDGEKFSQVAWHVVYGGHILNMLDLESIVGFEWDAGNARKSADRHGVTQAEAEQVFFNQPLLIAEDPTHSSAEPRFHALGQTNDGRRLHLTFTLRGGGSLLRVISARDMSRRERHHYGQEQ